MGCVEQGVRGDVIGGAMEKLHQSHHAFRKIRLWLG